MGTSVRDLDLEHRRSPIPDGLDAQEWHAVAHLRGWCHDSRACPLCAAELRAFEAKQTLARVTHAHAGPANRLQHRLA